MSWWNRLSGKEKQETYQPIRWGFEKVNSGLAIRLFRNNESDNVSLPINMVVSELRRQPDLEVLEMIEYLWFEEFLEEVELGYLLPYEKLVHAPLEIRESLSIPHLIPLELSLKHEGAVGAAHFRFVLEIHHPNWRHLERTGQFMGPWIRIPDRSWMLMEVEQFQFQQLLANSPDPLDKERIFAYVAEVRSEARRLGVAMDAYLEKQEYYFADGLDIDVKYNGEEIQINPLYTSRDNIPSSILSEMSEGNLSYKSDLAHGKIFVNPKTAERSEVIRNIPPISGGDIPRFADNPGAYLPEMEGIDLSLFSERVKSLGIRVYRAQPYVHAADKGRGWFELEAGIAVMDEQGERKSSFSPEEFEQLSHEAQESGNDYFNWNGDWVKTPENVNSFTEATDRLRDTWGEHPKVDVTKLPYILEIFENIGQLEFNQPILEAQKDMIDQGVLERIPPSLFKATLKPFQEDGFVWMKSLYYRKIGGLLADDMGLGKTIQVVSLLSYLADKEQLTPVLIVVPKTLIDNWVGEIDSFAPSLSKDVYVHTGTSRVKDPERLKRTGITLTTYQTLVRDQLAFGQVEWTAVICDEAQAIKNPTTAASKAIKAMNARFRLALTGTPVENGLSELWSILDYVQPGVLGSLSEFKRDYIDRLENEDRDSTVEQQLLGRIAMVYKRRTKSEELAGQLPTKTLIDIPVSLGKGQKHLYAQVIDQVKDKKMPALQAIQTLRALCSHPALVDERYKDRPIHEVPKLSRTVEMIKDIQQKDEKVLIFTDLRRMQELLRDAVREQFDINPNIINGMTERRQSVVDQFNRRPGFDIMILSPKAAGTGLTITSANHVIHYTRWWNPAVENQATDRVYRIGQDKPVQVYYPIVTDDEQMLKDGTVEEIVHRILTGKQDLASSIIVSSRSLDMEDEIMVSVFG